MNLDDAIKAHTEWKIKLRTAIQAKQQLDATTIARDNACPLGQWLHGEAKTRHSTLSSYVTCVREHAAFHAQAGRVAAAINAGKYSEADAMLAAGTQYAAASTAVSAAVREFRKALTS